MAEKEDQFASCGSESAMMTNPDRSWTQQPVIPRWCLKKENMALLEAGHRPREEAGEDSSMKSSAVIDDTEDESGLELSLGSSLGGPVSKSKPRIGQKNDGGTAGEQRVGSGGAEKMNEEISSRPLTRVASDAGISRTQAFWQEFDIARDNQHDDKPGSHIASDIHVRERHPASMSSLSSPMSSLSSRGLPDTWRSSQISSVGEEPKAAKGHSFWQPMHEKHSQLEQGNGNEELPMFQSLSRPSSHSAAASPAAWARYGQLAVSMPLLEGFKVTEEEPTRSSFPVSNKESKRPSTAVTGDAVEGGQLLQVKGGGDVHSRDEVGLPTSDPNLVHESVEQQRKQKKQEARKRRKAFMEEQKMQKKAKKEDEGRFVSGPAPKHTGSRSGTPPLRSKLSPSPPLQASLREGSSPPDSQEAGSASSGFHRTCSGLWSRAGGAWEGPAAGSSPEKTGEKEAFDQSNEDAKQLLEIRRALQRERDRGTKENVRDVDREKESESQRHSERKSPGEVGPGQAFKRDEAGRSQQGDSAHVPHENPAVSSAVAASASGMDINKIQADAAWVHRMLESQMNSRSAYQMAAALIDNKEQLPKGLPDLNGTRRKGPENEPPAADRESVKVFGPPDTEQAERTSERSRVDPRNGDAKAEAERTIERSTVDPINGDAKAEIENKTNAGGSHPTSVSIMAYTQPSNLPLMHMAYPFPVPVAGPNGLAFPMPYPFPYMMQYAPSADSSSAQERTGAPTLPSSFPGASTHPLYPVIGDVPTPSWAPVLRPHATSPHSPPRTFAMTASGMAEEDNRNSQGAKKSENVRNVSPTKDASKISNSLIRATSLANVQSEGGAFARLRSSPNLPPTPQFGPVRTRSESGEAIVYGDGSSIAGNGAFASLVAAVEASQGLSAAVASVNTSAKQHAAQPAAQRIGEATKLERTSSRALAESAEVMTSVTQPAAQPAAQWIGEATKLERTPSRALAESMEEKLGGGGGNKTSSQQRGDAHYGDSVSRTSNNIEEAKATHGNRFQQGTTTTSLRDGLISQMGQEGAFLKAGCAAGQMFGGSGSSPDLPWVTCKGVGPNGKTISGVLYKYNKGQVRIVCACHGRHMSPSEFVQHAGTEDLSNPEKNIVVNPFPHGNQAASAQG